MILSGTPKVRHRLRYPERHLRSATPVFGLFKAPDADAFNAAFKEYSASLLNKVNRPSVLEKLHELVQAAAELTGKVRHKEQERGL